MHNLGPLSPATKKIALVYNLGEAAPTSRARTGVLGRSDCPEEAGVSYWQSALMCQR